MFRHALHKTLIAAGILLGSQAAFAENRVALVIGQSAYRAVTALPNPANDAKAMSQLLGDAGFDVTGAADLSQNEMRQKVGEFAAKVAAKGPDTVALVFYAGHGLQIDGENFLVPVDVDPKREADIPLQAVRLNDILNTLTSVPSKMRILLLDACRNNPFPDISKTAGRGLAIVDAKTGAPGTFMSFSTSPGAEAEDGSGADSPYTTALLAAAKEPGLSIEDTFKRVRVSVNKATEGRQTPWDSSSLTDNLASSAPAIPRPQASRDKTHRRWNGIANCRASRSRVANELIVADGTEEAYQAFVEMFAQPPFGAQAREWLDRHRRMVAWNNALILNTAAAYRAFLAEYPGQRSHRHRAQAGRTAAQPSQFRGQPGRRGARFVERCVGRRSCRWFEPADQCFAGRPDMSLRRRAAPAAEESRPAAQEARRAGHAEARQRAAAAAASRGR